MEFCSIASGSSGNCIMTGSDDTHILIDAGISCKRITEGLDSLSLSPSDIDGIFITHEHTDHTQGIGVLLRKYHIPLYATEKTLDAISASSCLGKVDDSLFNVVSPDHPVQINDLTVNPIHISHDAADPVMYVVQNGEKRAAVVTDLGTYDNYTIDRLKNLDILLLESNHDIKMLQNGRYPYPLKKRILSDHGHLSNVSCGRLLCEVLHENITAVLLGHLSQENNYERLAYETVRLEVKMSDGPFGGKDFPLYVAKRDTVSEYFKF
ncbi:MAG: MBL fold metallo-hydrolase [Lachnospiraceae bacterium]|nr:MBL fold metallo-hydrolase [Lachnospiraceae bacterium]